MTTPDVRNRHGAPRIRPLHAHRFIVELDVVTAGDFGHVELARRLAQLSTAGLMGIVTRVCRVDLDGLDVPEAIEGEDGRPHELRPPTPDVVLAAARRLRGDVLELYRCLGLRDVASEALEEHRRAAASGPAGGEVGG